MCGGGRYAFPVKERWMLGKHIVNKFPLGGLVGGFKLLSLANLDYRLGLSTTFATFVFCHCIVVWRCLSY